MTICYGFTALFKFYVQILENCVSDLSQNLSTIDQSPIWIALYVRLLS